MEVQVIKEEIRDKWSEWSVDYDRGFGHNIRSEKEAASWKSVLARAIGSAKSKKVLDVGTGTGFLALFLAEMGHNCLGVDLTPGMLEQAKEKAKTRNLEVNFALGDAEALDLEDDTFDIVVNRLLLWTLPQPEVALREWFRVLKPGGKIVIIDGVWRSITLRDKAKAFLGNLLILIQERRNPWSELYGNQVEEKLPFADEGKPQAIMSLMEKVGLKNIRLLDMKEVMEAQNSTTPLRYRWAFGRTRNMVIGEKI